MRVIHISDTHLSPGHVEMEANFTAAATHIARARPDLVIHTGDVTRDAPKAPGELAYAANCLRTIDAEVLTLPGNHDVGDNLADGGHLPATPVTIANLNTFYDAFGSDRWVEERGDWRFVGLNSLLFLSGLKEEAEQWDWLETALGGHPRIALFLHKPLWLTVQETPTDPPNRYVPSVPRARLAGLIAGHSVRLVGCGHVHQFRQHRVGDTLFVWAPGTSFILPDAMQPTIGEKVCGLVEYDLGGDGAVTARLVQPLGMRAHDVTTLSLYTLAAARPATAAASGEEGFREAR
ncbi:MAG: metallophosphoesterase [Pseudomonadota bacterium]